MGSLEVIVCTHDRLPLLQRMLGTLATSCAPNKTDISVLMIANACEDGTREWLEAENSVGQYPLRWADEPRLGKSHALNRALSMARGEWLAFVDDDHRLPADFLENIVAATQRHPSAELLCGRVVPDWDGTEPPWVHDDGVYRIRPYPVPNFDLGAETRQLSPADSIPGGGNLIVRRDVAGHVGPFAVELGPHGRGVGGSEDTEWVLRALAAGFTLVYDPQIVQYHQVDPRRQRLGYVLRKAYARSRSVTRVRRGGRGLPLYLCRKAAAHAVASLVRGGAARRHHLVRLAATLGEMRGHLDAKPWEARQEAS